MLQLQGSKSAEPFLSVLLHRHCSDILSVYAQLTIKGSDEPLGLLRLWSELESPLSKVCVDRRELVQQREHLAHHGRAEPSHQL